MKHINVSSINNLINNLFLLVFKYSLAVNNIENTFCVNTCTIFAYGSEIQTHSCMWLQTGLTQHMNKK